MIRIIAKRQFLSNIFTFRFSISFIVCVILFTLSALILNWDYAERVMKYRSSISSSEQSIDRTYTYAQLRVSVHRPPSPLSTISEGADKRLGTSTSVGFDRAPTVAEESSIDNPLLSVFPSLDMITIIQIIMSLLALLFAYNTISGERENGTMKLILSNSIPRHIVIFGNFIGGMGSLTVPLLIGFILALIITNANPMVELSAGDYFRIMVIFVMAVLYLSVYYSMAMLFSSRIRRSATVLILLLFIWVVLVIIVPPAAAYISKHVSEIPDKTIVDNQAKALTDEWRQKMNDYVAQNPRPEHDYDFINGRWVMTGNLPYAFRLWYAPKEIMEWEYHGSIYGHNLRMEYEDRIWQLYKDYQSKLKKQASTAKMLCLFSPAMVFSNVSSVFASTNENNYLRFLNQAQDYRQELISYMKDKGGLSSYLLFTRRPIESFLSYQELLEIRRTQGKAAIDNIIGKGWDNAEPLDLNDLPKFNYNLESLSGSIYNAFMEIVILIFLNILMFSLAWISFLKADVR